MAAPDTKRLLAARTSLAQHGVAVLFEDNHLLGVSKPAGLLSQGGPGGEEHLVSLLGAYRQQAEGKPGAGFVGLVHRLDRNVSGVLVVAKTSKAASRLAEAFRERDGRLAKSYLAWVVGSPSEDRGELVSRLVREGRVTGPADDEEPEARDARLSFEVESRGRGGARLRVRLLTGVTHQIRAQLSEAGHPLLGDPKYGGPPGDRPALHALSLALPHPVGGAPMLLEAPVPPDLVALDRRLGLAPPVA